jgi:hypothetical protein
VWAAEHKAPLPYVSVGFASYCKLDDVTLRRL